MEPLTKPNPLLKAIIIVIFLALLAVLWIANNRAAPAEQSVDSNSIKELLETKPIHSVVKIKGYVESIFESKTGILYVNVAEEKNKTISVVSFPSMGNLVDPLKEGDQIEVTGIVSSYQENLQLQPMSVKDIKLVKRGAGQSETQVVPLREIRDYTDSQVRIEGVTATEVETFTSKADKEHLRFTVHQGNEAVGAIMYEGTWEKDDVKALKQGQLVTIVAKVEEFNGEAALVVEAIEPSENQEKPQASRDTIPLSRVSDYMDQTIVIGPVQFSEGREFTSKAGKTHLQFTVGQDGSFEEGIMFDGAWGKKEKARVQSSGDYYLKAEVSTFNNKISLIVEEIEE